MKAPENVIVHETPISTHWLDENGIFYTVAKKGERKIEHYQEVFKIYSKHIKDGNKLCLLSIAKDTMPISDEVRKHLSVELPKYVKAHAIVSDQPLESTLISTFLKLSLTGFPINKFNCEKEAKDWLQKYL